MSFGRSCRFSLPGFLGNRRLWLCAVFALAPLMLLPASGQDGPPLGAKAAAAARSASHAAAQKTAPAVTAPEKKSETLPNAQASARAGDPPESAGDPAKADAPELTGVAAECANLLDMAKTLKTDVDKTTQDVLSVAVVRDAAKIEQTAHKMREKQKH